MSLFSTLGKGLGLVRSVWDQATTSVRRRAGLAVLAWSLVGVAEVAVASLMVPFASWVGGIPAQNPDVPFLGDLLDRLTAEPRLLVAALLVAVVASASAAVLAGWAQSAAVWTFQADLSGRILRRRLGLPLLRHLSGNSSRYEQETVSETVHVANLVLQPLLTITGRSVLAVVLLTYVLLLEPLAGLAVVALLAAAAVLAYRLGRAKLRRSGKSALASNELRLRHAHEAFSSVLEAKTMGLSDWFVARFDDSAATYARAQRTRAFIELSTTPALQAVVLGALVLLASAALTLRPDASSALVVTIAYAGYRLAPAARDGLKAANSLRFHAHAVRRLQEALADTEGDGELPRARLESVLELDGVGFHYPGADAPTLDGVHLTIPQGSVVGLTGPSGGGKTTLVALCLGILAPSAGTIRVDGRATAAGGHVAARLDAAYVPQEPNLIDDTVLANVAIGAAAVVDADASDDASDDAPDEAHAVACLRRVGLDELAAPDRLHRAVGQRGRRLSGGQKQRLAIARALYRRPSLLVLDEATSNLDAASEKRIATLIDDLRGEVTVLLIAHRPRTLAVCDTVHHVRDGTLLLAAPGDPGEVGGRAGSDAASDADPDAGTAA